MNNKIKRKLLIIDDDVSIRNVVRMQLRNTAIELLEAEDTKGVMDILSKHEVDVVICDIKLKKITGFEVIREIQKVKPDMTIIMLTGYIEQEYYDTSLEMGVVDLIIKPVRKEKLLEALEKAFNRA